MGNKRSSMLFNLIAPVYGLFFHHQRKHFLEIVEQVSPILDLSEFDTVIDIGCGTGALCSVLSGKGLQVTGVDLAANMLAMAMKRPENRRVEFLQGNVLEGLPFVDKSFDIVISSHVAHGLKAGDRKRMYAEMRRLAKAHVIIHDYNERRSLLTSLVEWLEGGDYFNFIREAEGEMKTCFSAVEVIQVSERANWYICKP
ncbi:MAG TPA: class I SAM-dependent methyltransferase [Clostridia bacterium]|nr:class I SAM-dependent methyltransferase [Clostridia bacterium]